MAEPAPFLPVKLICGIIGSLDSGFLESEKRISDLYGGVDLRSPDYPFDLTDYYRGQMGTGLKRRFLSFESLIPPESLPEIKLRTNALEDDIRKGGRSDFRIVNIDPGYITQAALIMATTKNFSHRVPLRLGIYAHLELLFTKSGAKILDWTYPDFRVPACQDFFIEVRRRYLGQRR